MRNPHLGPEPLRGSRATPRPSARHISKMLNLPFTLLYSTNPPAALILRNSPENYIMRIRIPGYHSYDVVTTWLLWLQLT